MSDIEPTKDSDKEPYKLSEESQTFCVHAKLPSLNDWIRAGYKSRFEGGKMKKDVQEIVGWEIKAAGIKPVEGKVFLSFVWHERTRKRDKDNVASAKKFILDAMRETGVLCDDGNRYIDGFEDRFCYDGEDKVEVEIRPVGE